MLLRRNRTYGRERRCGRRFRRVHRTRPYRFSVRRRNSRLDNRRSFWRRYIVLSLPHTDIHFTRSYRWWWHARLFFACSARWRRCRFGGLTGDGCPRCRFLLMLLQLNMILMLMKMRSRRRRHTRRTEKMFILTCRSTVRVIRIFI